MRSQPQSQTTDLRLAASCNARHELWLPSNLVPAQSLFDAVDAGWLPANLSSPAQTPDCSALDTPIGSLIVVVVAMIAFIAVTIGLAIGLVCSSPCCVERTCCAKKRRPGFQSVLNRDDFSDNMVESLVASRPLDP